MDKRQVVRLALDGREVPYVPWYCSFTVPAAEKMRQHLGVEDVERALDSHLVKLGNAGFYKDIGNGRVRDYFGAVWDRSVDKDIGVVEGSVLKEPILSGYEFPDPRGEAIFAGLDEAIESNRDYFRMFKIGFSLYERAWTLRGMENLMMDIVAHPEFVHELLAKIADFNIAQIKKALQYDIDAFYIGDDWGQQHGLQMGPKHWRHFIKPQLGRMFSVIKDAGKYIILHSCGKVDEVFDDLIEIGLDCFNPFQPEVMDTFGLMERYRGRLAFHGGLSTQKTLPNGTVEDVKSESRKLIHAGIKGGYIFSPAHAVQRDVSVENIMAFVEVLRSQPGYANA